MRDIEACNVKEMLLDGATKEELMKALEDEIESAQKEIDEAKADKEQDEADMDQIAEAIACMLKNEDGCEQKAKAIVKGLTEKYPLI